MNMKSLLAFCVLCCLPVTARGAGPYDGIWQSDVGTYTAITQTGDIIVSTALIPDNENGWEWEAAAGELSGDTVLVETVVEQWGLLSAYTTVFTSPTTARIRIEYCTDASGVPQPDFCGASAGDEFTAELIFSAAAGGPYDGIWRTPVDYHALILQSGDTIVVLSLHKVGQWWSASAGILSGDTAVIDQVSSQWDLESRATIAFASPTSAYITINHCTQDGNPNPSETDCDFGAGDGFAADKIF